MASFERGPTRVSVREVIYCLFYLEMAKKAIAITTS